MLILTSRHHFLTTYIWDVLNVNANRTKLLLSYSKKCLNHAFVGATEKLLGCEKSHARTVAWSHHMERHAQSCVERYCELVNTKNIAATHSFKSLFVLVEHVKCCCTLVHFTLCYSRLDTAIHLTSRRLVGSRENSSYHPFCTVHLWHLHRLHGSGAIYPGLVVLSGDGHCSRS